MTHSIDMVFGFIDCSICDGSLLKRLCLNCLVPCQLRANHASLVAAHLAANVFGQENGIRLLSNAFFNMRDGRGPLAIHIAGDNGVGKSLAANVIANAIFSAVNNENGAPDGMLLLRGEIYHGQDSNVTARFREEIRQSIVAHLSRCPEALIVFDEVEKVHSSTLRVLEMFLDDTVPFVRHNGVYVRTDRAAFILISDFGREGVTTNMSVDQQTELIMNISSAIWNRIKVSNIIDVIVPFRPLDNTALEAIAQHHINEMPNRDVMRLNNVKRIDAAPRFVTKLSQEAQRLSSGDNGRSILRLLNTKVDEAALHAVLPLENLRIAAENDATLLERLKRIVPGYKRHLHDTDEYEVHLTVPDSETFQVTAKLVKVAHVPLQQRNEL